MMTAAEFVSQFMAEDPQDGPYSPTEGELQLVLEGAAVVEHKSVYHSDVWEYKGQFFEVTYTRDNTGYWGDGESYDPEVIEVFPYVVTKTRYRATK